LITEEARTTLIPLPSEYIDYKRGQNNSHPSSLPSEYIDYRRGQNNPHPYTM
jgi:ribosomal protein L35AE/L33A